MGVNFTDKQKKVLNARNHNILVSAAAGSGKTAVLVERIIRMISEKDPETGREPLDIDRLLVVTFTRAAAAQMRERIGEAISKKIAQDPGNRHLQRQETLLHRAQITTIDSFCSFLLRNNFSDIGLDPGFRTMDQTETALLKSDTLLKYIEGCYASKDQAFLECVDYFCPESSDSDLEGLILRLSNAADSHPDPKAWLADRKNDYAVESVQDLYSRAWMRAMAIDALEDLKEVYSLINKAIEIAERPFGPAAYLETFESDLSGIFGPFGQNYTDAENEFERIGKLETGELLEVIRRSTGHEFVSLKRQSSKNLDVSLKDSAKTMRDLVKKKVTDIRSRLFSAPFELTVFRMQQAAVPFSVLIDTVIGFNEVFAAVKREKNVIDFSDMEHLALNILLTTDTDEESPTFGKKVPSRAAASYRSYFDEVLIDEYQDSNEVQELLLSTISGEAGGRYARFMVGDVKQSIYRFRNARPEIFVEKFNTYKNDDSTLERIDLDQNFRSRKEVLDSVNDVFFRIMRPEVGGVEYDDTVSLKPGAVYPDPAAEEGRWEPFIEGEKDPYTTELIQISNEGEDKESGSAEDADGGSDDDIKNLPSKKKEILVISQRIKELVGRFPVKGDDGMLRPARYSDIVILVRSGSWNDAFRDIFEGEGIPIYIDYKGGYFASQEIREVMQVLNVLDNPRQDIPLYGMLHGFFGGFTEEEITSIKVFGGEKNSLYDSLLLCAGKTLADGTGAPAVETEKLPESLAQKCRDFVDELGEKRKRAALTPIHELLFEIISLSGYEEYVMALPSGEKRKANLDSLAVKAAAFEQTEYTGLFSFLRYIDSMHQYEVDYGEANVLDEKANVVRLMTIHKSKGLEFPICFVAGLSSSFAYKGKDTKGMLILDSDLGAGLNYVDLENRYMVDTLKKAVVADKIACDSLGEELRVLYVAMTRAKEKLILTGFVRDAAKYGQTLMSELAAVDREALRKALESGSTSAAKHLPKSLITGSGNFFKLINYAYLLMEEEADLYGTELSIEKRVCPVSDISLKAAESRVALSVRKETLDEAAAVGIDGLPLPELARSLDRRFSYRYAHKDLEKLYTKRSVSDIKHESFEKVQKVLTNDETGGEGVVSEYKMPQEELCEPAFIRKLGNKQNEGSGGSEEASVQAKGEQIKLSGAKRGTAIHRCCELIDYSKWSDPSSVTAAQIQEWGKELISKGLIPSEYEQVIKSYTFMPFLSSDIAKRMAKADRRGQLKREQPFVIGVNADTIDPSFPASETILVQGIIDAFFIEDDEDGKGKHIIVIDYKTDYAQNEEELVIKYKKQLDIYGDALSRTLGIKVGGKIIYSFRLGKEIEV